MEQDCKSCSTLLAQNTHSKSCSTLLSVVSDLQSDTIEYEHLRCGKKVRTGYLGLQILILNGAGLQILLNPTCAKCTHNKSCSTLLTQNAHNKSCSILLDQNAHTTNPAQPYLRKAHSMLLHSLKNDSDNTNVCITESAFSGVSLLPHGIIVSTFAAQTRNSKLKLLSR